MKQDKILLLGDPRLFEVSEEVKREELEVVKKVVQELHDILFEFKAKYGAFRGIAAPQVGFMKRLIYINIDKPLVIINPEFTQKSKDFFDVWDDCMCFPNLLVQVSRYQTCTIKYRSLNWEEQVLEAEGSMSELLQHEYDHLDGILAIQRAKHDKAFVWRKTPYSSNTIS